LQTLEKVLAGWVPAEPASRHFPQGCQALAGFGNCLMLWHG